MSYRLPINTLRILIISIIQNKLGIYFSHIGVLCGYYCHQFLINFVQWTACQFLGVNVAFCTLSQPYVIGLLHFQYCLLGLRI